MQDHFKVHPPSLGRLSRLAVAALANARLLRKAANALVDSCDHFHDAVGGRRLAPNGRRNLGLKSRLQNRLVQVCVQKRPDLRAHKEETPNGLSNHLDERFSFFPASGWQRNIATGPFWRCHNRNLVLFVQIAQKGFQVLRLLFDFRQSTSVTLVHGLNLDRVAIRKGKQRVGDVASGFFQA